MKSFTKKNNSSVSNKNHGNPFFGVQPKLNIGKSDDKYEKEADATADQIVAKSSNESSNFFGGGETFFPPSTNNLSVQKTQKETIQEQEEVEEIQEKPIAETLTPVVQLQTEEDIQEKCETCGAEENIQKLPFEDVQQSRKQVVVQQKCATCGKEKNIQLSGKENAEATSVEKDLQTSKGGGSAMDANTKQEMESGFGADFSNVKIHTDSNAVQMNQSLGAHAFTNGNDIYFNEGNYNPSSNSGKHLLAHELTHTIQQGASSSSTQKKTIQKQEVIQRSTESDTIIDLLEGWTSSADSAAILQTFTSSSLSGVNTILNDIKNEAGDHNESRDGMIDWLMGDLVAQDKSTLLNLMIRANSTDAKRIVAQEIDSLISGYTSESNSQEILSYVQRFNGSTIEGLLKKLETQFGYNKSDSIDRLFDDLTRLHAERLRLYLFNVGNPYAAEYAGIKTAKKIEDLLVGYTGVNDSEAILSNFRRTPELFRTYVHRQLEVKTQARWQQTAEDALMEDMQQEDYETLRSLGGINLRAYDYEKSFLEWAWDGISWGADYLIGWIEYAVCGIAGAIWGIISAFIDLVVILGEIVFIAVPDLIGWMMFHITSGRIGREEKLKVEQFFTGLGQLFDAPSDVMSRMWNEATEEAALIEGPFSECQTAFYWMTKVGKAVTDIVLIFIGGYGLVKGALTGLKAAAALARAGQWGELLMKIITLPSRFLRAAGSSAATLVRLLRTPLETLSEVRNIITIIRLAAADEGYWQFLRRQAGIVAEGEVTFWQEQKQFWLNRAAAQEGELGALEGRAATAAEPATSPNDAVRIIEEVDVGANSLSDDANNLLDEVRHGRRQGDVVPEQGAVIDEALNAFKTRIRERITAAGSRFSLTYTDAELDAIIARGRALGLQDQAIEDLIYIGSREAKPITANDLMQQMDNWINVVSQRGYPYRFTDLEQFGNFQRDFLNELRNVGLSTSDARIQGSSLRTPNANDVDLVVFIQQSEFNQLLVNRFSGRISRGGTSLDLTSMSHDELMALANDIRLNPRGYNAQARTFMHAMLNSSFNSKSDILRSLKAATTRLAEQYPNLNIEAIGVQTPGGGFDLQPYLRIQ